MSTRQGQRGAEEQDLLVTRTLTDAGIPDALMMPEEERMNLYRVLVESKVAHVEGETQRPSLGSQSSPSQGTAESHFNPSLAKQSSSKCSDEFGSLSNISAQSPSSDDLFEDTAPSSSQDSPENQRLISKPIPVLEDDKCVGDAVVRPSKLSLAKPQSMKSAGRGRGTPIKTKYPALPILNPGQKSDSGLSPSSTQSSSPQHNTSSPSGSKGPSTSLESPLKFQEHSQITETAQSPEHCSHTVLNESSPQSATSSQQSILTLSPQPIKHVSPEKVTSDHGNISSDTADEEVLVDVNTISQEEATPQSVSSVCDKQADSPASVEDAAEEEEKEPVKTVKIGKLSAQVSSFEALMTPMPTYQLPIFFKELEKYRGNKVEWMAKATEMAQQHRQAFWEKLTENPVWGPPISDCGYNKQTLFKQMAPKYSKLFSNTSEKQVGTLPVRGERQSKSQALSKIHDVIDDEWSDQNYHSLRRPRHRDARNKEQPDGVPGKEHRNSRSLRQRTDGSIEVDSEGRDDALLSGSSEQWPSNRQEQRGKLADSDSEVSPEPSSLSDSHDVYKYEDDEWEPASNRNKKNMRRGSKSIQGDIEVEARPSYRGRGTGATHQSQRGKSVRARVQRGAISRVSEHATNSRHKVDSSDQTEVEANARNSADTERCWLSTDQSLMETNDITPQKFYPSKATPRSHQPTQPRRPRESPRPSDFPSTPGSSGNYRHHDERNEAAVAKLQECPICGKGFPLSEIEAHCSGCVDFKTDAVGEKPPVESVDSEDPDTAVGDLNQAKFLHCESKETASIRCSQCNQCFTRRDLISHAKECIERSPSTSSGSKRVLENDDGPLKKVTRLSE